MELAFSTDSGWVGRLGSFRRQRLKDNTLKLLTTKLEKLETSVDTVSAWSLRSVQTLGGSIGGSVGWVLNLP